MVSCCICYTTDPDYLLPTFVSAMQARHNSSPEKADVFIFGVGTDAETERYYGSLCAAEGLDFRPIPYEAIDGAPAAVARLFLTRLVPDGYVRFLYIDGDTQIRGSLDPLLDCTVPNGMFLAAADPMAFKLPHNGRRGKEIQRHFKAIGFPVQRADKYFNSGALLIDRAGWEAIGPRAWELLRHNDHLGRFYDQDALNIVRAERRIPMSLRWNFPIFLRNCFVEHDISPRIIHFMSRPKPWQGNFPPWSADDCAPYENVLEKYPELARIRAPMPIGSQIRYHLQQRYKGTLETFTWGLSPRRRRLLCYERQAFPKNTQ